MKQVSERRLVKTFRIHDLKNNGLAFDLRNVLDVLGPRALASFWGISEERSFGEPVSATGDSASCLEELSKAGARIDGAAMRTIARNVTQVIWGEFRAYDNAIASEPWMTIRAIDSTFFEVASDDESACKAIRSAFHDVREVLTQRDSAPAHRE